MTYRRPLLATDLSKGSGAAARILPRLLEGDARGAILLVSPAPDAVPDSRPVALLEMERRAGEARQETESAVRAWAEEHGLLGWEAKAAYGPVGPTIASEAAARDADVLALGSTGAGMIGRALLGSTARSALRHAHVDTLIARGERDRVETLLFATDFQEPSLRAARRARKIARHNESRVTLLHVISPDVLSGAMYASPPGGKLDASWLQTHVLESLARTDREHFEGRATKMTMHDRPAHGIVSKAKEIDADLVVVGSHGAGRVDRLLLGSVAESVAERAGCSVLVVRA